MENNDLYIVQEELVVFIKNKCEGLGVEISEHLIDLVLNLEMDYLVEIGIAEER